jgi:hypothetical protein
MNFPENILVSNLKHNDTTNSAKYRHSTRSRGDIPIGQQSRAQRALHLRFKVVAVLLDNGCNRRNLQTYPDAQPGEAV